MPWWVWLFLGACLGVLGMIIAMWVCAVKEWERP